MNKSIFLLTLIFISSNLFGQTPKRSETVSLNNKTIHYEIYGQGTPLFLLHGYTQSSVTWKPYIEDFEKEYEVYLIDLTGHGQSAPFKEDLSIRSVARDLNSLIQYLELEQIKAIGFSFGGDVLYQLTLLNPTAIERMITIGAIGTWSVEDFPEYLKAFTFENRDNFPWLKTAHASDDHIRALMKQFKNYIVRVSDQELQSILPEVLVILGDDDIGIDLNEVARLRKHLRKSDLWILPNISHGAHEGETKMEFIEKTKWFLNK